MNKMIAIMTMTIGTLLCAAALTLMSDPIGHRMSLLPDYEPKAAVRTGVVSDGVIIIHEEERTRGDTDVDTIQAQRFERSLAANKVSPLTPQPMVTVQSSAPLKWMTIAEYDAAAKLDNFGIPKKAKPSK